LGDKKLIMQYRNIPYKYNEWTTWNGELASGYSCEYFDFYPYHVLTFGAKTEDSMKQKIDNYLDNRSYYEIQRNLNDKGCTEYYEDKRKTSDNYTGD
jgi:hypothetical protein